MLRDGISYVKKNQQDPDRRFKEAFLGFVSLEEQSHDDRLQYRLGWMLLNGIGTDKDEARAKEYFDKVASVGNPFACYQLAKLLLSDEKALPQDVEKPSATSEKQWRLRIPMPHIFSASSMKRDSTFRKISQRQYGFIPCRQTG